MIHDVAVLGCGPAGSAVATLLARQGLSCVVFERGDFSEPRPGETLGGEIGPLLRVLGAWEDFEASAPLPFRSVLSVWGGIAPAERLSITHPFGDGYHVDRADFDALLARTAERAGAELRLSAGRCVAEPQEQGFRVRPARGTAACARFLVDASGRGAPGSAALQGRRGWFAWDRLVGVVGWLRTTGPSDVDLLIEACEQGWWYSAPQPGGRLVAALMTDADLVPAGRGDRASALWRDALARAGLTRERCATAALEAAPRIMRADSGCLLAGSSSAFCAVGDAARSSDPLTGQGVARALRSGLEAAAAINRALAGAPLDMPASTASLIADLDRSAAYYELEARWPDARFWQRRRPPDWRHSLLTLDPTTRLHWRGRTAEPEQLAAVEALLPRRAIAAVLELLRSPQPAHEALSTLREHAPLPERRLLVGLQALVACAALEASAQIGP